ncbi:MAG: FAD-dependent oxidoreductase [FCB group bacterium]|nr:FAD-dependent oxidoreductase [FCB group bacterium]
MKHHYKKLIILGIITVVIVGYFKFDLGQYFNFAYLKSRQIDFQQFYLQHTLGTIGAYFLAYVVMAALSLPGAAIMTLAAGSVFGVLTGTVVVSFASTIGATLAFMVSRYLFRDAIEKKFSGNLRSINAGIEREGAFYLFTLRLIPVFPFFVINLVLGLTKMKALTFYLTSQIGMLAGTLVYVNAGTQLAKLESPSGILSPAILGSFVLLGIFPLIAKKIITIIKSRKYLRRYKKPSGYDYNVVVIGAGSGGLVSAYIAAAVKAKVALVEKNKMGGDCLNTGCVPSKAFIRSAKMLHYAQRAKDWGFNATSVEFDFAQVMERVQKVIRTVEPHDSVERYTDLGVEVFEGAAKIIDPYRVEVKGNILTTRNIIIAAGAGPFIPDIPGIEQVGPLTSDTVWGLRKLPRRLVIVGGGPIGSELAQSFARFGSTVTQVEAYNCVLSREDDDVSELICEQFASEGIKVLKNHRVTEFKTESSNKIVICEHQGKAVRIECDEILLALGRRANVSGYGLEDLEIHLRPNKTIETDEFLRTNYPNIYAVGDVTGPYQFTHFAAHQAWYASVNALFSPFKKFKADYRVIPWTTFTDPEVARVGLNEKEAQNQGVDYEVTKYGFDELDRAIADEETKGFIKVLTVPGKDKILGVTIAGPHAGDIIIEYITAMKYNIGLNKILGTIHVYPTIGEANKAAAGVWKKAHAPESILKLVKKFHAWRR